MKHPWDINRALIVLGALIILAAGGWFLLLHPSHMVQAPLVVGALLSLVIVFWAPAWMYLVAGLLASGLPLVVFFVFGAIAAVEHPGSGIETALITFVLAGAVVALLGGVLGFVQALRRRAPRAGEAMRAPQGAFAGLLLAMFVGMVLANGLATKDYLNAAASPISTIEAPEETRTLRAEGIAFAPNPLTIPAGKLVEIRVPNGDPVYHTLSYRYDGEVRTMVVPPGTEPRLWLKIDEPQTLHFWCDPHAGEDHSGGDMFGEIVVE